MSEYGWSKLKALGKGLLFALCLGMLILGQRRPGWAGLGLMALGLAGILFLLWLYNRKAESPADGKKDGKEEAS